MNNKILNILLSKYYNQKYCTNQDVIVVKGNTRIDGSGKILYNNNSKLIIEGKKNNSFWVSNYGTYISISEKSNIIINGRVQLLPGVRILLFENSSLSIGNNTFINSSTLILSKERIDIGENCAISFNVTILDSDYHIYSSNDNYSTMTIPVKIGNKVWVGCNSTILKGVTIGDNSIIAAGSVITKDVPAKSMVAGNPATVIKKNVDWYKKYEWEKIHNSRYI